MIIAYISIALLSALGSTALMWPLGSFEAIVAASVGGSLTTVVAAASILFGGASQANWRVSKGGAMAHFSPTWRAAAHA